VKVQFLSLGALAGNEGYDEWGNMPTAKITLKEDSCLSTSIPKCCFLCYLRVQDLTKQLSLVTEITVASAQGKWPHTAI